MPPMAPASKVLIGDSSAGAYLGAWPLLEKGFQLPGCGEFVGGGEELV